MKRATYINKYIYAHANTVEYIVKCQKENLLMKESLF